MKGYLLDENLPASLDWVDEPPAIHVFDLALQATDSELWDHAREKELAIVTKDADFRIRALISKPPPWVVHLRFGNLRRRDFQTTLERLWPLVEQLLPHHRLISVFADRVEATA